MPSALPLVFFSGTLAVDQRERAYVKTTLMCVLSEIAVALFFSADLIPPVEICYLYGPTQYAFAIDFSRPPQNPQSKLAMYNTVS